MSGGAYGSPQLLLLSGLGPAQHLQDMGITVVRDMPAVGSNLHDHFNSYVAWRCSKAITLNDLENSKLRKLSAGVRYALFRSGPMASNGIHAGVFTRSDPRLERPDIQLNMFEWSTLERGKTGIVPHPFPGFTISPVHLRPDGRGTVRLGSADPLAPPAVLFDYLRTEYDMQAVIFGIRLARKIAEQPALKPYVAAGTAARAGGHHRCRPRQPMCARAAYPTSIPPVPVRWAMARTPWSIHGCACMGSTGCASRMPRSCRWRSAATQMRRPS